MASLSFFLCGLVATGAERRVRRRPPARSVAVKRTAEMENCDETIFYTSVVLGGQTLQLIVDSGSADWWVVGKDCPGGCNATTVFDRDASPTFAASGGRAEIDYEDGDGVAGARARDTLEWAGVHVDAMDFLEVDRSGFWICGAEDGVLGLGPSAESRLGAPVAYVVDVPHAHVLTTLRSRQSRLRQSSLPRRRLPPSPSASPFLGLFGGSLQAKQQ